MEDDAWLTTARAAELWSDVLGVCDDGSPVVRQGHEQTMRKFCREGIFDALGVRYMRAPGGYMIERASLCWFLWRSAQDTCRRAERAVGISEERTYEIIGIVGETHPGEGQSMDDLWHDLMHREFLQSGLPPEGR